MNRNSIVRPLPIQLAGELRRRLSCLVVGAFLNLSRAGLAAVSGSTSVWVFEV